MTNKEKWPIGTRVRFCYDNLNTTGTIIKNEDLSTIVLLDTNRDGWYIEERHRVPMKYVGKRGWYVPYSKLQRLTTKLGNII